MNFIKRILTTTSVGLLGGAVLATPADAGADSTQEHVREIRIIVQGGYQPDRIEIVHGEQVQLRFLRKESGSCTREVVFPSLGIRKELPEGKPVVIQLPALEVGEYEFQCGMDMIKGKLVVRAES